MITDVIPLRVMKSLLACFSIAFVAFAVIGYSRGKSRSESHDLILTTILSHLDYSVRTGDGNRKGEGYLLYVVDNQILFKYDVKTDALESTLHGAKLAIEMENGFESQVESPVTEDLIFALLGGSTAGFTLKDGIKTKKKKHIVFALLGGLSGYSLGYKLGVSNVPAPDSDEILAYLNDSKNWIELERQFAFAVLNRSYTIAELSENKEEAKLRQDFAAVHYSKFKKKPNLEAEDLFIAARNLKSTIELVGTEKSEPPIQSWLSWWWIGLFVGLIFGAAICLLIHEHRKTKRLNLKGGIYIPTSEEIEHFTQRPKNAG